MKQYQMLLKDIISGGEGSIHVCLLSFPLSEGFPLVTTHELDYKKSFDELLLCICGACNFNYLRYGETWEPIAIEVKHGDIPTGSVGPIFGHEFRYATNNSTVTRLEYEKKPTLGIAPDIRDILESAYGVDEFKENVEKICKHHIEAYVDQLWELTRSLKDDNYGTYVMSSYSPMFAPDPLLSPQANVKRGKGAIVDPVLCKVFTLIDETLHLNVTLSNVNVILDLPDKIAQFALLVHLLAFECDLKVGTLSINIADAFIAPEDVKFVTDKILVSTDVPLCTLNINNGFELYNPAHDMLTITNYKYYKEDG